MRMQFQNLQYPACAQQFAMYELLGGWEMMGRMCTSVCHRVQARVLANRLNTRCRVYVTTSIFWSFKVF